jgi:Sigma-54 interaction domain
MAPRLLMNCMTSGNSGTIPRSRRARSWNRISSLWTQKSEAAQQVDAALSAPERLITLDQLAQGSERVGGMVVRSAQVRKVLKTISRLGPYKATVLIHGESGTGKELVARAAYARPRARRPVRDLELFEPGRVARGVASLAMSKAHLPTRARILSVTSARPTVARSFSMKSAHCRFARNPNFCARSRRTRCSLSKPHFASPLPYSAARIIFKPNRTAKWRKAKLVVNNTSSSL